MIACISPSAIYLEETISTLNYATRTMSIKNRPYIQMDEKDQIIYNLTRENEALRLENAQLKAQVERSGQGRGLNDSRESGSSPLAMRDNLLPPISTTNKSFLKYDFKSQDNYLDMSGIQDNNINSSIQEFQSEIKRLKREIEELRPYKENAEKQYGNVIYENNLLKLKLENLEKVFLSKQKNYEQKKSKNDDQSVITNLMAENAELKRKVIELEEITTLTGPKNFSWENGKLNSAAELIHLRNSNLKLQEKIEQLMQKEKDLTEIVNKMQYQHRKNLYQMS